jgi:hypothetical protein
VATSETSESRVRRESESHTRVRIVIKARQAVQHQFAAPTVEWAPPCRRKVQMCWPIIFPVTVKMSWTGRKSRFRKLNTLCHKIKRVRAPDLTSKLPSTRIRLEERTVHSTWSFSISSSERVEDDYRKKPSGGISHAERLLRIDCHKVHAVALIANARERNKWINDELLQVRPALSSLFLCPDFRAQARLLSLTPLAIHNSFAMIHKSRIPDDDKRGYLFELAISRLASWWADTFFTVKSTGHLLSRTFEDVQQVLRSRGLLSASDKKGKGKALPPDVDPLEDLFEDSEVEVVNSAKSLMKHALMRSGSRDVSSQLFAALCRALGIPTRLVVSLQSVPWQTNVGRPKTPARPKGADSKGKGIERGDAGRDSSEYAQGDDVSPRDEYSSGDHDHMQADGDSADQTSSVNANGKGKGHTIKLRKTKSVGRKLRSPRQSGAHLFS